MDLECNLTSIEYGCIYIRSFGALVNHALPFPRILIITNDRRWYGVGGTIQLAIFGMVAAKVKMNANGAHTFLEVQK